MLSQNSFNFLNQIMSQIFTRSVCKVGLVRSDVEVGFTGQLREVPLELGCDLQTK